jgi:IMP dehydrogenase/GMP reductase
LTTKTKIKIPMIAANMDTVISDELADVLIENGSYPIFHRFTTFEKVFFIIYESKKHGLKNMEKTVIFHVV